MRYFIFVLLLAMPFSAGAYYEFHAPVPVLPPMPQDTVMPTFIQPTYSQPILFQPLQPYPQLYNNLYNPYSWGPYSPYAGSNVSDYVLGQW